MMPARVSCSLLPEGSADLVLYRRITAARPPPDMRNFGMLPALEQLCWRLHGSWSTTCPPVRLTGQPELWNV